MRQLIVILLLCCASLACANTNASPNINTNVKPPLILSRHPDYLPFTRRAGNSLKGLDIDIFKQICSRLKLHCRVLYNGNWSQVLTGLRLGRIDMASSLYKLPGREKFITFSLPYAKDPTAIFVRLHSELDIRSWEDLKKFEGIKIQGVSAGNTFDTFAQKNLKLGKVEALHQGFYDLIMGNSDFFICGYYPALSLIHHDGLTYRVQRLPEFIALKDLHFGVSKNSPYANIMPKFNAELKKLIDSGYIAQQIQDYRNKYDVDKDFYRRDN